MALFTGAVLAVGIALWWWSERRNAAQRAGEGR
jgi:hypothetical protein